MKKIISLVLLIQISCGAFAQTLSSLTPFLGITKFSIIQLSDSVKEVRVEGVKRAVNDYLIDFNNVILFFSENKNEFVLSNSLDRQSPKFFCVKQEKITLNLIFCANQKQMEINSPDIDSRLSSEGELYFIIYSNILKEIVSNVNLISFDYSKYISDYDLEQTNEARLMGGGCQRSVLRIGGSRSIVQGRISAAVSSYLSNHSDCTLDGGTDVSCLWDNHACLGTAFFHCTGPSCDITFSGTINGPLNYGLMW